MDKMQQIMDQLESLQYDILFWKRKEEDPEKQKKLADYDNCIDEIIDKLYNLGLGEETKEPEAER